MNKKIILFLALLLFPLILRASAVERVPGVEVGDYFLYDDIVVYWSSTDPNATLPEEFKEFNETEWMYMSVVDVVDKNVTGQAQIHYKNGTDEFSGGWVDVETGEGENMTMFVIAANLGPGDSVYTTGYYSSYIINETILGCTPLA